MIICVAGLSLLLYPSFSNYWNSKHSTRAISHYVESIGNLEREEYQRIWQNAVDYNNELCKRENPYLLSDELREKYESLLDVSGTGVMGYIEISKLGISLPVYHGTAESVLQIAIGHLDWTSLPVGGESAHCVLSGHRGLPSAKLFTDLDKLREGDIFTFSILNETLTYEVDQIRIVEPIDVKDLVIENGKDYVTLVTCTPYGINTHRLLVRGHRVENQNANNVTVISEAVVIDTMVVASIVATPILIALLLAVLLKKPPEKEEEL